MEDVRTIHHVVYEQCGEEIMEDFSYDPQDKMSECHQFATFLAMYRGDIDNAEITTFSADGRDYTWGYERDNYCGLVCDCDMLGYDAKDYTLSSNGEPSFCNYGITYCPNCGRFVSHYDERYFYNTMDYEPDVTVYFPNGLAFKAGKRVE